MIALAPSPDWSPNQAITANGWLARHPTLCRSESRLPTVYSRLAAALPRCSTGCRHFSVAKVRCIAGVPLLRLSAACWLLTLALTSPVLDPQADRPTRAADERTASSYAVTGNSAVAANLLRGLRLAASESSPSSTSQRDESGPAPPVWSGSPAVCFQPLLASEPPSLRFSRATPDTLTGLHVRLQI